MKRQAIYTMLATVLTAAIALSAAAQTENDKETGRSIRETLFKDGMGPTVTKAQTVRPNTDRERSVRSPQELRALIFENYTPPGQGGAALKGAVVREASRGAGTVKLASETAATETAETKQTPAPVSPPSQGDTKEEQ